MKALVVGCGSIGRRHIGNLLKLDKIEEISVFTQNADCLDYFEDTSKIAVIGSLDDVDADFAIIANETSKHVDTAVALTKKNIHLFIEKPVSHDLKAVHSFTELVRTRKIKVFIAYNLRFLGVMSYLKGLMADRIIGDLYFARIEAGLYLPLWRSGRDYRNSYSAKKEKGGGVAFDLSHEVDYMRYLFGDPCYWKVLKSKVSELEIDSNDVFEGIYQFDNGFMCSVHLDYLQQESRREIRIIGSKSIITCDFTKKKITKKTDDRELVVDDEALFDINKSYMDELAHFIKSIEQGADPKITLEDGIKTLRLLEDGHV